MHWRDWSRQRKLLVVGLLMAIVTGLLFAGPFRRFQAERAAQAARRYLAAGDVRSAALSAQRTLDLAPDHVIALEVKALILGGFNDPESVTVWKRVAELTQQRTNWLNALASAIRFRDLNQATNLAIQVETRYPTDPSTLRLLSAYAIVRNQLPAARGYLDRLGKLDPNNIWDRFNRATLALADSNRVEQAAGEKQLLELGRQTNDASLLSLRVLIQRAADRKDTVTLRQLSDQLMARPNSTWSDRFDHVLWQWRVSPELGQQSLTAVLQRPLTDEHYLQLARQLIDHGLLTMATQVSRQFSTNAIRDLRLVSVQVELLQQQKQWGPLASFLAQPALPTNAPLLELWRARAAREMGLPRKSDVFLDYARQESRHQPGQQTVLAQLLDGWGWALDAQSFRWQQVLDDVDPLPALRRLASDYYASGNTVKLASVMERWLVLEPDSASVKNNLALACLLLRQNLPRAHELAAQALAAAPTNDAFRSTYIYSLLVQNKNREARAELDKLAVKNQPAGALYAALAYQAAGEVESARQALQRAGAGKLLPEEKKLHQQLYERLFP